MGFVVAVSCTSGEGKGGGGGGRGTSSERKNERKGENESRAWPINHTFVGITLLYTLAFAGSKGSPRAPFSPATRTLVSPLSLFFSLSLPLSCFLSVFLSVAREPSSHQTRELRKGLASMYSPEITIFSDWSALSRVQGATMKTRLSSSDRATPCRTCKFELG